MKKLLKKLSVLNRIEVHGKIVINTPETDFVMTFSPLRNNILSTIIF